MASHQDSPPDIGATLVALWLASTSFKVWPAESISKRYAIAKLLPDSHAHGRLDHGSPFCRSLHGVAGQRHRDYDVDAGTPLADVELQALSVRAGTVCPVGGIHAQFSACNHREELEAANAYILCSKYNAHFIS
jgi:hypothetical protein